MQPQHNTHTHARIPNYSRTRTHTTYSVRAAFDPRSFEKILAKRNEEAQESAARYADDYLAGVLSPSEPGIWACSISVCGLRCVFVCV